LAEDIDLLSELRSLADEPQPEAEPSVDLGQTASGLNNEGLFDDLALEHEFARQSQADEARDRSSLGVLGSWDTLDEAGQSQWLAGEKEAAKSAEQFWGGVQRRIAPVRDVAPPNVPPQAGLLSVVRPVLDWATGKSESMLAHSKRRQFLADQIEAGVKAAPRTGTARNIIESTARGFGEGTGHIASGYGRNAQIVNDALYGRGVDAETYKRLDFVDNGAWPHSDSQRSVDRLIIDAAIETGQSEGYPLFKTLEFTGRASSAVVRKLGDFISAKARAMFPEDEARQSEFLTQLSQGAGSMLAFMGPTLVATSLTRASDQTLLRVADELGGRWAAPKLIAPVSTKVAEKQASATAYSASGQLGAEMQAEAETQAAEASGADDEMARNVFLLNLPAGASEALPIGHLFESPTGRTIARIFGQGGEEATQEFGQSVASNLIAQMTYDPERKWDDGAWESAAVGFILGTHTEAARSAYARARYGKQPAPGGAPTTPPAQAAVIDLDKVAPAKAPQKAAETQTKPGDAAPSPAGEGAPAPNLSQQTAVPGEGADQDGEPAEFQARFVDKDGNTVEQPSGKSAAPTFDAVRKLLPTDAAGDPDLGALTAALPEGKTTWNALSPEEKTAVYQQFGGDVADLPAAEPAKPATTAEAAKTGSKSADASYDRFVKALANSKTTQKGWAKAAGVSDAALGSLIARAAAEGLLRQDRNGVIRRTGKVKDAAKAVRERGRSTASRPAAAKPAIAPQPSLRIPADQRLDKLVEMRDRTGKPLGTSVVNYARELEAARGNPAAMDDILARLGADKAIKKQDMFDLASLSGEAMPKSATKAAALQSIIDRHADAVIAREGVAPEVTDAISQALGGSQGSLPEDGIPEGLQGLEGERGTGRPSAGDRPGSASDVGGRAGADDDVARPAERVQRPTATGGSDSGSAARVGDARAPVRAPDDNVFAGLAEVQAQIIADQRAREQARLDRVRNNYQITDADQIGAGGAKAKVRGNIAAIQTLKKIEDEGRLATADEKKILVKYVGWGAFAQDVFATHKNEWAKERAQLQDLLTPEEFKTARASTLNAHYTSPEVIKGMWSALEHLGFKGGRVIEPAAGIGHFIGMTPANLRENTDWTAVELDSLSGRLTKALYGAADVRVAGYETQKWPDGFFDLAISNVPFGDYKLTDPNYKPMLIHDYFFVKSLDKVRPGGIVAFITSAGTLDKQGQAARREMAKRATFLGAIRLPGGNKGAFAKNAGTEVTTDIIFLRRRLDGEPLGDQSWIDLKEIKTPDGTTEINAYFADNPEQMLGRMRLQGTMYGKNEPVLIGPTEGLEAKITEAAQAMPADAMIPRDTTVADLAQDIDTATDGIKEGAFYEKEGKVYRKVMGVGQPQKLGAKAVAQARGFIEMRDVVNELLAIQSGQRVPVPGQKDSLREALNASYDAFVSAHGPINKTLISKQVRKDGKEITIRRQPNLAPFEDDPDAFKVSAIEVYDEKTGKASKAAIFSEDILAEYVTPEIKGPLDALAVSLNEKGRVDLPFIAERLGVSEAEASAILGDELYLDPVGDQWRTAAAYLSGDVVAKLDAAKSATEADAKYARNVTALEKVQPEPLTRVDIAVPFGAPWVPADVYQAFATQALGGRNLKLSLNEVTKRWAIISGGFPPAANTQFGTSYKDAAEILEAALNSQMITITQMQRDGSVKRLPEAEQEAQAKVNLVREMFQGNPDTGTDAWVWEDEERARHLEALYNKSFNRLVREDHDGSHLTFPGLARVISFPDGTQGTINLSPHRVNAVWRIIQNGNTLIDHVVGAGKTWTSIMAGMEMKRLGQIQRPMYVVPNHMLEQFSTEFYQAYPNAKLLVATKDQMSAKRRREFAAKVASDKWDGIIITHSAFGRVGMSEESYQDYYESQIAAMEEAKERAAKDDGKDSPTVKDIEKAKKRLETKLDKLLKKEKKDQGVIFEELGVDFLFVDEAHLFKNLWFPTRHTRVKGIATGESQRATDLYVKIRHIEKSRPGRSAVFMTGTPVSNTMAELYIMQRYLQKDVLDQYDIGEFDAWAATFGQIQNKTELAPNGRDFKDTESFSKFVNVPELMTIWSRVADTQTADMLNLPRPKLKGGKIRIVENDLAPREERAILAIIAEMEKMKGQKPKKGDPNFLSMFTKGIQLATDERLVNPDAPFNPTGKIGKAVDNILRVWKEGNKDPKTPDKAQIVFLDMGVPGSKAKAGTGVSVDDLSAEPESRIAAIQKQLAAESAASGLEAEATDVDADAVEVEALLEGKYNLYQDLKERLIAGGIPSEQIAFIHDAKNDEQKSKLFAKVKSGEVRVLVGSTAKMGVGTNVQKLLIAMHHIDAPWKPADVEQRDGRILRQGNLNPEIEIYRYITKKSFDAYRWQILDRKSKFIGQIRAGARGVRSAEDIDPPLPEAEELKAAATGDPRIIEHAELTKAVRELEVAKKVHLKSQAAAGTQASIMQTRMETTQRVLADYNSDAQRVTDLKGDNFAIKLDASGGRFLDVTDRKQAGEAIRTLLLSYAQNSWYSSQGQDIAFGDISGFRMAANLRRTQGGLEITAAIEGAQTYTGATGFLTEDSDPTQLMMRWTRLVPEVPLKAEAALIALRSYELELPKLQAAAQGAAFPKQAQLDAAKGKLADLTRALKPAPPPQGPVADPGTPENMAAREAAARQVMASAEYSADLGKSGADTSQVPGFGTDAWKQARVYVDADGQPIQGFDAAVDYLYDQAIAKSEAHGPVRQEQRAFILIGFPGAGKSTIANPLGIQEGAIHASADDAKLIIPEYNGGANSVGAHEESSLLAKAVLKRLLQSGTNIVLEKLGSDPTSITRPAGQLREAGYHVTLIHVDVPKAVAMERAIGRWRQTGRTIPADIYDDLKAGNVYGAVKNEGAVDETGVFEWQEPGGWHFKETPQSLDTLVIPGLSRDGTARQPAVDGTDRNAGRTANDGRTQGRAGRRDQDAAEGLAERRLPPPKGGDGLSWLTGILESHGIDTAAYGQGEAKPLATLLKELQEGEAQLVERDGQLIRRVSALGVDVYANVGSARLKIKEDRQVFADGRVRQRELPRSLGEKLKAGEDPAESVGRALAEELGITEFQTIEPVTEKTIERESGSYPGLASEYRAFDTAVLVAPSQFKPQGYEEKQAEKTNYYAWEYAGRAERVTDDAMAAAAGSEAFARKGAQVALRLGKALVVEADVVAGVQDAIAPMLGIVPAGVRVGVLERLEPLKAADRVYPTVDTRGIFRAADGSRFSIDRPRDFFLGSRAFWHGGSRVIGMIRLSAATGELGDVFRGGLGHEIVHALKSAQMLDAVAWSRLVAHAESLRILDKPLWMVLRQIGEPDWNKVPADATLFTTYSDMYAGRPNIQALLEEEAVAHLVELYHHGMLTAKEYAPVQDVLDDILSGRVSEGTSLAVSGDRAEAVDPSNGLPSSPVGAGSEVSDDIPGVPEWMVFTEALEAAPPRPRTILGEFRVETKPNWGSITYTVHRGKNEIANFYVRAGGPIPGSISVMNMRVDDKYQRRGIASAVYDLIEADIAPSRLILAPPDLVSMSADARAFWTARNPELMAQVEEADRVMFGDRFALTAFHGSPHDFDKFDASKIGTGEGAQAYGHGLYFAESPDVAATYRDFDARKGLGQTKITLDGKPLAENSTGNTWLDQSLADSGYASAGQLRSVMQRAAGGRPMRADVTAGLAKLDELEAAGRIKFEAPGRMYEVRLNAEPEQFLDWDKPLSQQSEAVKKALGTDDGDLTGAEMYQSLLNTFYEKMGWHGDDDLGRGLGKKGIVGIRYLDGMSRDGGAGGGTSNYVIFPGNEHLIEIVAKDGEPVSKSERKQAIEDLGAESGDGAMFALAPRVGAYTSLGLGAHATYGGERFAKPIASLTDLVESLTKALGLTVRQGRLNPGLKAAAGRAGGRLAGQQSAVTGVTRLALPNDLATLAHEGGHALEARASLRTDLAALKQAHIEELTVAPAPDRPAPPMPTAGFTGLELDADTQALAKDAVEADKTWRTFAANVAAAKQAGRSYDAQAYVAAQRAAGLARASLARRLGKPTADAVIADVTNAAPADIAAYLAVRFSAAGVPTARQAVTASPVALSEGFAEWFRIYLTNPAGASDAAPTFFNAFEDMLEVNEPAMLEALQDIQTHVEALAKAAPVSAVRSRVQTTVVPGRIGQLREEIADKGFSQTVSEKLYAFYHAFFDARHPMKRAVRFLIETAQTNLNPTLTDKQRVMVKAIDDPYKLWRLAEHSKVHATAALQNGIIPKGQIDPVGPSYTDALTTAFGGKGRGQWTDENLELFGSYLTARRMLAEFQRFDNGELEQPPDQVIGRDVWQAAFNELEKAKPDFARGAAMLDQFTRNALKLKLDNGFITQDIYDELIQRHGYAPLNRIMDDGSPTSLMVARGQNKRRLIYRFQGSTRDFINPLESIAQDMYATQARIALNDVIRAMDRLARAAGPGGGAIAERIPATEFKGTTMDLREALKAATRTQRLSESDRDGLMDIIDDLFDQDASATIFKATPIDEKSEPIVYLWEGGKKVPIRLGDNLIAQDIFQGMVAFGQNNANWLIDGAALGTQALRAGITKAPAYILTNFLRDQLATWILSENFTPFVTGIKGMKHVLANDVTAKRYAAFAGLMGGVDAHLIDTAASKRDVLTLRRKGFSAIPARSGLGQVWQTLLRSTEITEAASRFGHFEAAYQRALKDGMTPLEAAHEAAYAAHDVMDFSRKGAMMGPTARIIAFLNAALQGLDAMRRTASGERNSSANFQALVSPYLKAATGSPLSVAERKALPNAARGWVKAVLVGLAGVSLAALYWDDPEYEEFDDHMRATHWFFKLNGTWFRYPKPFELAFFSNLFEAGFERVWKGNERALEQFTTSLKYTMIPPHEINVANIYYEWNTGIDMFRDRPIVPMDLKKLPPEMQFNAYTSELGKLMGNLTGLAPIHLDALMGNLFGTWGRDVLTLSDYALPRLNQVTGGAIPGVAEEPRAEKSPEDYWIAARFTRRAARGSQSSKEFWEQMASDGGTFLAGAEAYKTMKRAGQTREARDYLETLPDEEKAFAVLEGEFNEGEQDLHPLNRARQVLAAASGIRKEMVLGRLFKQGTVPDAAHKYRKPEEIVLAPQVQKIVNETLEDIAMREARNALIVIGHPGWANKQIMPTDGLVAELKAAAPQVAAELETRLTKGKNKTYAFEAVQALWPQAKERLLKDGAGASLYDLKGKAATYKLFGAEKAVNFGVPFPGLDRPPGMMRLGGPPADPRGKWEDSGTTRRAPGADSQDWVDRLPAVTGSQMTPDDDAGGIIAPDVLDWQRAQPTDL
jgi:N12 class adenine-specific DNA methylase/predicted kinase